MGDDVLFGLLCFTWSFFYILQMLFSLQSYFVLLKIHLDAFILFLFLLFKNIAVQYCSKPNGFKFDFFRTHSFKAC